MPSSALFRPLNPSNSEIAILDFGSQYTHLIARRIRELGVKSRIHPNDIPSSELKNAVGIFLSGGPRSIAREPKLKYDPKIFELGIPILGLCYGHQLIAEHFGGRVESSDSREYGLASLSLITLRQSQSRLYHLSPILNKVPSRSMVWMSHGDHVSQLPDGFIQIATTGNNSIAAMAEENKKIYGFQFHPEVHHTEHGRHMLSNFLFDICGVEKNWTTEKMLDQIQNDIRQSARNKNIFLLISGGVDSTVCFALLEKTLGKERVYGLHVDHGLMRQYESKLVKESFKNIGLDDLHIYNAEDEMLVRLKNVYDPEEKRKIIGEFFIDITGKVMNKLGFNEDAWLLGQGTIYPDTIESGGTKHADKIKTHHNRVDRIQEMIKKGLVIEPIKELYKDEVREIGLKLGLPENLINRHPFPGPGLAVRCLCSVGSPITPTLQHFNTSTLFKLPIKSVGVQGDERTYAHPALLTSQNSDWQRLSLLSPKITNENPDINRVLIHISGDLEKLEESALKQAYVTKERLNLLRKIDAIVNNAINTAECSHIWQFPVVLVPFGYNRGESIVLRPVESKEAMTVSFAELPLDVLNKIKNEIENLNAIDYIFYDITNKPPGTIEWE